MPETSLPPEPVPIDEIHCNPQADKMLPGILRDLGTGLGAYAAQRIENLERDLATARWKLAELSEAVLGATVTFSYSCGRRSAEVAGDDWKALCNLAEAARGKVETIPVEPHPPGHHFVGDVATGVGQFVPDESTLRAEREAEAARLSPCEQGKECPNCGGFHWGTYFCPFPVKSGLL